MNTVLTFPCWFNTENMSLSRRMITPTVCGLEKETSESKMHLFITKKRTVNLLTCSSSNKLTLIAPYLPTGADPWSPLHCFSLYTAEDLWAKPWAETRRTRIKTSTTVSSLQARQKNLQMLLKSLNQFSISRNILISRSSLLTSCMVRSAKRTTMLSSTLTIKPVSPS